MFTGALFDTPYGDLARYCFFGKWMFYPIFTFYNPNGFSVSVIWSLVIGLMYLTQKWETLSDVWKKRWTGIISFALMLSLFLCRVALGRLSWMSWGILLVAWSIWLWMRYPRGLKSIVLVFCFCVFLLVGENSPALGIFGQSGTSQSGTSQSGTSQSGTPSLNIPTIEIEIEPIWSESDSTRVNLLINAGELFLQAKGLGVGLGNVEILMDKFDNTSIRAVHCWIAEIFTEFGIFCIVPFLVLLGLLFKNWFDQIRKATRNKDQTALADILFQFCTAFTYPLLSTANSSSWGVMAMWVYLAFLIRDNSKKNVHSAQKKSHMKQ